MRYYATYFDNFYLPFFLNLVESMQQHCSPFVLFAVCLDEASFQNVSALKLEGIVPISFSEYEKTNARLLAVKPNRSRIEYYFTLGPTVLQHIFDINPNIDALTYLDADLYFFDSPEAIFDEANESNVTIISHKFNARLKSFEKYGKYNVAWITFRRTEVGMQCLNDWSNDCIDWCHDYVDGDKYGDQKYLDSWIKKYEGVCDLQHKGANLAPWNFRNFKITERENRIYIDEQPLIFYHFAGLKQLDVHAFTTSANKYLFWQPRILKEKIYLPFIKSLLSHLPEGKKLYTERRLLLNTSIVQTLKNSFYATRRWFFSDYIKI